MCLPGSPIFERIIDQKSPRDDAPVITGTQKNVADPIDTSRESARLKKERRQERIDVAFGRKKPRSPNDLRLM